MWLNICGLWPSKKNANNLSGIFEPPVDVTFKAGQPVAFFAQYIEPENRKDNGPKYQVSITAMDPKQPVAPGDDVPF